LPHTGCGQQLDCITHKASTPDQYAPPASSTPYSQQT
jgi:hypothetical protein